MPLRLTFAAIALCFSLASCAHYHLGAVTAPAFQRLYIEPVENKALLPQSVALISTQIREAFLNDGRVELVNSPEQADATLHVTLVSYSRAIAALRSDDTGLARKLQLVLHAECTLHDNRTGRNFFEKRPITAAREAYTDNGQLQSEYNTLPLLAEVLSHNITHATLDVW
ncbi:MAG: hypothetical protein KGJ37_04460 [Verrucomicrobiota bacterium]|nr:hypothetical protein [Verrucomicrobiota bacterium]